MLPFTPEPSPGKQGTPSRLFLGGGGTPSGNLFGFWPTPPGIFLELRDPPPKKISGPGKMIRMIN